MNGLEKKLKGVSLRVDRNRGVNTFGQPIKSHVVVIEEQYEERMAMRNEVKDYLVSPYLPAQSAGWKTKRFAYISMKPYGKESNAELIPAEFGIVVFSFEEGIVEAHSGFFVIGKIPFGEKGEVMLSCEVNGFPVPGKNEAFAITPKNFMTMIVNLTNKYGLYLGDEFLFFCVQSDIPMINCCLKWIMMKATSRHDSRDSIPFQILPFETLLMEMSLLVPNPDSTPGVIRHEGGAGKFIYDTRYDFHLNLGCDWHRHGEAAEKLDRCCKQISFRRVYNALHYLCHLFNQEIKPKTHSPYDESSSTSD